MSWMIREDQLDPDQRDFINVESKKTGNIWVKGFAGSGKSVLLVHSLKDVLNKEPHAKVAVVVYTHSLIDMFKTGMKELNIPESVPVMTYYHFVEKDSNHYDYVFCDEVQDLPAKVLEEMQKRVATVIVAGDSNQSIFDKDPKWREPVVDPDKVGDIIKARAFTLNRVHRLTRSIITAVQKLLPSMNIWGAKRDTTKVDVNIRLCEATGEIEEVKYIYQEALKGAKVGDTSVVLIPTHKDILKFFRILLDINKKPCWNFKPIKWDVNKPIEEQRPDYDDLNHHIKSQRLKIQYIGNSYGSLKDAEASKDVIVMTYHSSKGLDFDNVFLPFLNNNLFICPSNSSIQEQTLFMVAMTRSKKNLYLTYFGVTHNLVDAFKSDCTKISITDLLNPRPNGSNNSNPFDF